MTDKINLLFPVEIINRELDFRLFLACLGAHDDNRVWIGRPRTIYSLGSFMQEGVYVGKNIFGLPPNLTLHRYDKLKRRGFKFVHLDEEGAVYRGGAESWRQELRRRFDPTCLAEDDYMCTWGDFQRDFYKSFEPKCSANVRTTGHPRFDLYKPDYRDYYAQAAKRLRERYGDFVLINSNLHRVNHHEGLECVFSERLNYHAKDSRRRSEFFDRWRHLSCTFTSFVHLINRLSVEFPDTNIVVRPHPSENKAFYDTAFGDVPNVHAVREGSVGPWLLACKAMIHDGCTTGLEAYLADVSIINFKPVADAQHDAFLPNLFGRRCSTEEEVVEHLHDQLKLSGPGAANEGAPLKLPEDAYLLLDNFRRDTFPQLVAVLDEAASSMKPGRSSQIPVRFLMQEGFRRWEHAAMSVFLRRSRREKLEELARLKFYGFDRTDLDQRFDLIQKITRTRVKYSLHSSDLLSVESM